MKTTILVLLLAVFTCSTRAQWNKIDSLVQGGFSAIHFINADTGFTFHGKLRKTVDGGQTWDTVPTPMSSMLFDFAFPSEQVGYVVGGAWFAFPDYYSNCIMKTTDGGQTWDSVYADLNSGVFTCIAALDEDHFFATGNFYLVRSNDGGLSLDTVPVATAPNEVCIRVRFVSSSVGHVLTKQYLVNFQYAYRLYETTDGGDSWQAVFADTTGYSNLYSDFTFLDADKGLIANEGSGTMHRTTNGGLSWQVVTLPDTSAEVRLLEKSAPGVVYANVYRADLGSSRLYKSVDYGLTWQMEPLVLDSFELIADISFGTLYTGYAVTDKELFKKDETPPVGITDPGIDGLQIFPNPAQDHVRLSFPRSVAAGHITLRDLQGRVVRKFKTGEGNSFRINVAGVPAGVYHLQLQAGGGHSGQAMLVVR